MQTSWRVFTEHLAGQPLGQYRILQEQGTLTTWTGPLMSGTAAALWSISIINKCPERQLIVRDEQEREETPEESMNLEFEFSTNTFLNNTQSWNTNLISNKLHISNIPKILSIKYKELLIFAYNVLIFPGEISTELHSMNPEDYVWTNLGYNHIKYWWLY